MHSAFSILTKEARFLLQQTLVKYTASHSQALSMRIEGDHWSYILGGRACDSHTESHPPS